MNNQASINESKPAEILTMSDDIEVKTATNSSLQTANEPEALKTENSLLVTDKNVLINELCLE